MDTYVPVASIMLSCVREISAVAGQNDYLPGQQLYCPNVSLPVEPYRRSIHPRICPPPTHKKPGHMMAGYAHTL